MTRTAKVDLPGNCQPAPAPRAEIASDCSVGAVITFSNGGGGTVVFSVARDGEPAGTVRAGPSATTARTFAMSEEDTDTFTVSAPGMEQVTATITFDCQQPQAAAAPTGTTTTTAPPAVTPLVLGEQVERPAPAPAAELPRTGIPGAGLALAGFGLVAAGLPLARLRRRSR